MDELARPLLKGAVELVGCSALVSKNDPDGTD